jgi:hypothetical protein
MISIAKNFLPEFIINMDRISFNGIRNVNLSKVSYEQFGHYLPLGYQYKTGDLENALAYGKKHYNEIHLECDLTDDVSGNDLKWFREILKKSKVQYEFNCISYKNPNHIDLYMKRFDVEDELGHTSNSEFKINNFPIMLTDNSDLPIYTFMAKLCRKIKDMPELPDEIRKYAKFVNKSVHKEAVEFIER